jgi:hypothetical protein
MEHPPDVIAQYRFYTPEEGGRSSSPQQYYRGDFMYATDSIKDGIYMIYHEFIDSFGNVLPIDTFPVSIEGAAYLRILNPKMRVIHRDRLCVGIEYFIMEGSRKVGKGIVTAIVGLHTNPILL